MTQEERNAVIKRLTERYIDTKNGIETEREIHLHKKTEEGYRENERKCYNDTRGDKYCYKKTDSVIY